MQICVERAPVASGARRICKKIAGVAVMCCEAARRGAGFFATRDQHRRPHRNALRRSVTACLLGVMLVPLPHGAVSAGKSGYALGYDVVGQAEQVLKRAASASPHWHSRQGAIQRDIYDITFLIEQAVRASEKLNDAAKQDYARQALTLLQRGVRRGHFDANSIEPVLKVIQELLPNVIA